MIAYKKISGQKDVISSMFLPVAIAMIFTQLVGVIATIIDAPATVLNVVGNTSCAMLTARMVEGKNWNK